MNIYIFVSVGALFVSVMGMILMSSRGIKIGDNVVVSFCDGTTYIKPYWRIIILFSIAGSVVGAFIFGVFFY